MLCRTCPHRLGESNRIVYDNWVLEVCILRATPRHTDDTSLEDGQSLFALHLVEIVSLDPEASTFHTRLWSVQSK